MNEPIISPWLIYFLGISQNLNALSCIIGVLLLVIALFVGVWVFAGLISGEGFQENKKFIIVLAGTMPFAILSFAIAVAIPEREWIIATIVANEATGERITEITDAGKDLKDELKRDFVDILRAINNDEIGEGTQ